MDINLEEAIEIYSRALCAWKTFDAPSEARRKAQECAALGDDEGYEAWSRVAECATRLMAREAAGSRRKA